MAPLRDKKTVSKLNELRRQAVELRLAGNSLAETQSVVGLSAPTIIAACKAFRQGGWDAVQVGPRGRPRSKSEPSGLHACHADLISSMCARPAAAATLNQDVWSLDRTIQWLEQNTKPVSRSTAAKLLEQWNLIPPSRYREMRQIDGEHQADADCANQTPWKPGHEAFVRAARRKRAQVLWVASRQVEPELQQVFAHDLRGKAFWSLIRGAINATHYLDFFKALHRHFDNSIALVLPSPQLVRSNAIHDWVQSSDTALLFLGATIDNTSIDNTSTNFKPSESTMPTTEHTQASTAVAENALPDLPRLTHLQRLESESIHIMREVVAEAENPVMMYSVGKDSAVMLHLARKAFFPAPPPFPLLHVDTTWKFKAMYKLRDSIPEKYGMELITHTNPEGLAQKVNPFTHGSSLHTDIMKTQALKQALDEHRFDFAFGGARRDEEKSRAKERVFSFRTAQHRWDAKNQRPELWQLYNTRKQRGESIRVFPLSNWTELDIWQYIRKEDIEIVPLYLAAQRPVVERDGSLIMVDDDRMPLQDDEVPQMRSIRFRTLGCYPLTGAVESTASTLEEVIQEMLLTKTSERQGRMIDHDAAASMEKKKQEGYF